MIPCQRVVNNEKLGVKLLTAISSPGLTFTDFVALMLATLHSIALEVTSVTGELLGGASM